MAFHAQGDPLSGRVAIIGTRGYPSYYGGFETAVRKLAPYLADQGWAVTVYTRPGQSKSDDPDLDCRITIVYTRGLESRALSTMSFGLTACLHAMFNRPDVALVMNCANGYWLPLLRMRGIPVVVNVDGIEWEREKWSRFARRVFWLGAKMTAKFANALIVDAHAIGDYWRRHFRREGIFIPYGGEFVEELELSEGSLVSGKYILLVARFVPENTVAEFLSIAGELSQHYDVVLVGTSGSGGGPLDDEADRLDRANDRVHWLRHVSDDRRLFSLWQHAGVYFHGHSVGGTNPALVQAMACGAKILARDTVFNREVLADTANYCNPNPEDILASVLDLMEDDENIGEAAARRGAEIYNWPDVCAGYEEALYGQASGALEVRGLK